MATPKESETSALHSEPKDDTPSPFAYSSATPSPRRPSGHHRHKRSLPADRKSIEEFRAQNIGHKRIPHPISPPGPSQTSPPTFSPPTPKHLKRQGGYYGLPPIDQVQNGSQMQSSEVEQDPFMSTNVSSDEHSMMFNIRGWRARSPEALGAIDEDAVEDMCSDEELASCAETADHFIQLSSDEYHTPASSPSKSGLQSANTSTLGNPAFSDATTNDEFAEAAVAHSVGLNVDKDSHVKWNHALHDKQEVRSKKCGATAQTTCPANFGDASSDEGYSLVDLDSSTNDDSPPTLDRHICNHHSTLQGVHRLRTPTPYPTAQATGDCSTHIEDLLHRSPTISKRSREISVQSSEIESLRTSTESSSVAEEKAMKTKLPGLVIPDVSTDILKSLEPHLREAYLDTAIAAAKANTRNYSVAFLINKDGRGCMMKVDQDRADFFEDPQDWKWTVLAECDAALSGNEKAKPTKRGKFQRMLHIPFSAKSTPEDCAEEQPLPPTPIDYARLSDKAGSILGLTSVSSFGSPSAHESSPRKRSNSVEPSPTHAIRKPLPATPPGLASTALTDVFAVMPVSKRDSNQSDITIKAHVDDLSPIKPGQRSPRHQRKFVNLRAPDEKCELGTMPDVSSLAIEDLPGGFTAHSASHKIGCAATSHNDISLLNAEDDGSSDAGSINSSDYSGDEASVHDCIRVNLKDPSNFQKAKLVDIPPRANPNKPLAGLAYKHIEMGGRHEVQDIINEIGQPITKPESPVPHDGKSFKRRLESKFIHKTNGDRASHNRPLPDPQKAGVFGLDGCGMSSPSAGARTVKPAEKAPASTANAFNTLAPAVSPRNELKAQKTLRDRIELMKMATGGHPPSEEEKAFARGLTERNKQLKEEEERAERS